MCYYILMEAFQHYIAVNNKPSSCKLRLICHVGRESEVFMLECKMPPAKNIFLILN
jgi:hypothetical protein